MFCFGLFCCVLFQWRFSGSDGHPFVEDSFKSTARCRGEAMKTMLLLIHATTKIISWFCFPGDFPFLASLHFCLLSGSLDDFLLRLLFANPKKSYTWSTPALSLLVFHRRRFRPQVFLDIEKNTKPDALICTNTSGLNIAARTKTLSESMSLPGRYCLCAAYVFTFFLVCKD